jgi:hypothetical protein
MYDVAFRIAEKRHPKFENRFKNWKLRTAVKDDSRLIPIVEGVVGYLGDIGGATFLDLNWKEQLRNMVMRTGLLSHRDDYDLLYYGWKIDVKVEDFGANHAQLVPRVVGHSILRTEVYGERLVNAEQFDENYRNEADMYFYSCMERLDPRDARTWYPVGWIRKEKIRTLGGPQDQSSSGARLPSPAYLIPNDELIPPESLRSISANAGGPNPPRIQDLGTHQKEAFLRLALELGIA